MQIYWGGGHKVEKNWEFKKTKKLSEHPCEGAEGDRQVWGFD